MEYQEFLASKMVAAEPVGFEVAETDLNPALFGFQKAICRWALHRGRAAVFSECGSGKTPMQIVVADHVHRHTGRDVLILAPLAVSQQTVREGVKFGINVTHCRTADDLRPGINITNYERLHHFSANDFGCIVIDESSILKGFDGKLRKQITEFGRQILFRFAFTATPAPNDLIELTNHAEFLDIMNGKEILALFFTQDGNTTHKWRLKGHAREAFWRWLASWSVALRFPSDLGYSDDGFILPPMTTHTIMVDAPKPIHTLFPIEALTLNEQRQARRDSLTDRVQACADLVNNSDERWVVWCELNDESDALAKTIPDAVEIRGSDDADKKERALLDFTDGKIRVLISKASMTGHGMNWQHVARMAFVGLSHSYEQFYQAKRRIWRFGQTRPVEIYIVATEADGAVLANIERKEKQASEMMDQLVRHMTGLQLDRAERGEMVYTPSKPMIIPSWLEGVVSACA